MAKRKTPQTNRNLALLPEMFSNRWHEWQLRHQDDEDFDPYDWPPELYADLNPEQLAVAQELNRVLRTLTDVEIAAHIRSKRRNPSKVKYTAATDPDLIDWERGCASNLRDPEEMLARMEEAYRAGDRTAVMAAVFICCDTYPDCSSDKPFRDMWSPDLPDWVKNAFRTLYSEVLLAKANTKTWDEAFGSPHRDRKLERYRTKIEKAGEVYRATIASRLKGEPLEGVGQKFGISTTIVEEYQRLIEDQRYRLKLRKTDT